MPLLTGIQPGDKPKALIAQVSETLLTTFHAAPLLNPYDIYQHLMDYWAESMQDDTYLIAADGWVALPRRIVETDKKGKTKDKGWTCDLLPKPYIVARYFADEQAELEAKQAELDGVVSQLADLEEEHGGEDGAFSGFDKINAAQIKDRLAEIGDDPDSADERAVLKQWQQLSLREAALKKTVKTLESELDKQAHDRYATLNEAEVKMLVVEDKWLARLQADVQQELARISQTLAQRIRELAERYGVPLPKLEDDVAAFSVKVGAHLKRMGVTWK
ncbi:type I restriction endonuclease subunit S [Stutzerimonas stutzeri]|uniref:type I restriction endonuclease subunit S n=1 Tax=Stutzerimonas stutzeri TaxID=316 RepID=UPI001CFF4713|nr:type I restriction endonuclease subunit S [Stutzerimonas stutzeri]